MEIDDKKRNSFMEMMRNIAKRHNCAISFDYDDNHPKTLVMGICSRDIAPRRYEIFWPDAKSQTEAGVAIWSAFFKEAADMKTAKNSLLDVQVDNYIHQDVEATIGLIEKFNTKNTKNTMEIKDVIFNAPATIVLWNDGTKTVVKCQDEDEYDPEKGLAMAITKKAFGNKGNYCNEFNKWIDKYYETHAWEIDIPRSVKTLQSPFRYSDETWDNIRKSFEKAMMNVTSTAESTKQFCEIMDRRIADVKSRKKNKEEK